MSVRARVELVGVCAFRDRRDLFEDIRARRKDAVYVGRDSIVEPGFEQKVADHAQTPTLFDFARVDPVAFQP